MSHAPSHIPRRILATAAFILLAVPPCAAQKASLPAVVQGRVIDSLIQPISNADVSIDGTQLAAKTDSYGRFALRDVPSGAHVISVRKIGYGPIDIAIQTPRDTSLTPVVMTHGAVVLKTIVTHTIGEFGKPARLAYTSKYDGFYQRRAFGGGGTRFFTHEDIDRMDVLDFKDILRRIPHLQLWDEGGDTMISFPGCGTDGIMIKRNGTRVWPRSMAGSADATLDQGIQNTLAAQLGTTPSAGDPLEAFRGMRAPEIEGIEVYPTSSTLPVEAMGNACAAIFVWTR